MENKKLCYFASLNTTKGFHSDFQRIFDPNKLNQIYILKGGPGTGKSTLMSCIASEAERRGFEVERFLCSSDPNSLDGILICEKGIAILDGTNPHSTEANFPGIIENIINLGEFWEISKLLPVKDAVMEIIRGKNLAYKRAYNFLKAYGEIYCEVQELAGNFLLKEKMLKNIKVQRERIFSNCNDAQEEIRNCATFYYGGKKCLDSFEKQSKKIWIIEDLAGTASLYLDELAKEAREKKQRFYVSFSPENPLTPNALYFPETSSALVIGKREYEKEDPKKEYRYVNMKRFLDREALSRGKEKIKFANKCMSALLEGATEAFSLSSKLHANLESYYVRAMNFKMLQAKQAQLLKLIFS